MSLSVGMMTFPSNMERYIKVTFPNHQSGGVSFGDFPESSPSFSTPETLVLPKLRIDGSFVHLTSSSQWIGKSARLFNSWVSQLFS